MSDPLYKIADWKKHFEKADSRKVSGPLKWVPITTQIQGLSFRRLTQEPKAAEILGAWILMLQTAGRQESSARGTLATNGVPMTAIDFELLTGIDAKVFDHAFAVLSKPSIGWLVVSSAPQAAETSAEPRKVPSTGQDTTLQDRTLQDTTPPEAGEAPVDLIWAAYPKKSGKKEAFPQILAAIKSKGFDAILANVRAYAAAVALWPEAERCFVPDPVRWFKRGNYDDDPSTWRRNAQPIGKQLPLMR